MVERLWCILFYLIGNSYLILPSLTFSLRDGSASGSPVASVIGSNANGSTVHIMLQRSTTHHGCDPGYYQHEEPGATRARVKRRSTSTSVVGRSGQRTKPSTSTSGPTLYERTLDQPFIGLCLPCSECPVDQFVVQKCTVTRDTVCQPCGDAASGKGPCVSYDNVLATPSSQNDNSGVNVIVDSAGSLPPLGVANKKQQSTGAGQGSDLNINIQEAGRDERNSWYFLSLCALIGLLVFLSLVMGAYLVSVKVTSWWRYQRPVTVRRRGQSFHEDNHITMSALGPPLPRPFDDIITSQGSREVIQHKPREVAQAEPRSHALVMDDGSFASTSKIQVVELKSNGGLGFGSIPSYNSYVVDEAGDMGKRRYAKPYHAQGPLNWHGYAPPRENDSSDYSYDDEEDGDYGRREMGAMYYSSSRASPSLHRGTGKYLYHSLPLNDVTGEDFSNDGEVHIVQWPFSLRPLHNASVNADRIGGSRFHSAPTPHYGRVAADHGTSYHQSSSSGLADCDGIHSPSPAKIARLDHPSASGWMESGIGTGKSTCIATDLSASDGSGGGRCRPTNIWGTDQPPYHHISTADSSNTSGERLGQTCWASTIDTVNKPDNNCEGFLQHRDKFFIERVDSGSTFDAQSANTGEGETAHASMHADHDGIQPAETQAAKAKHKIDEMSICRAQHGDEEV